MPPDSMTLRGRISTWKSKGYMSLICSCEDSALNGQIEIEVLRSLYKTHLV